MDAGGYLINEDNLMNEDKLKAINEIVSRLYDFLENGQLIINSPKNEQLYWDINYYLQVELKDAIEQLVLQQKPPKVENTLDEIPF